MPEQRLVRAVMNGRDVWRPADEVAAGQTYYRRSRGFKRPTVALKTGDSAYDPLAWFWKTQAALPGVVPPVGPPPVDPPPVVPPPVTPPELVGAFTDGDAFTLRWGGASNSTVFVVYSAYAEDRMFVPISGWVTGRSFVDPNVYDGRHVFYRVYKWVGGVEMLHAEFDAVQPTRLWTEGGVTLPPGRYEGLNIRNLDRSKPEVTLQGCGPDKLYEFINCRFAGTGAGIKGWFSRVRMRGCRSWRLHPGGPGLLHGAALDFQEFRHADIQSNYFEDLQTCYFTQFSVGGAVGDTLLFNHNFIRNVVGQYTDASGGYRTGNDGSRGTGDYYRSQALQISQCKDGVRSSNGTIKTSVRSLRGAQIMYNYISNEPFYSRVEDCISFYQTHGYADSKILVWYNMVDGAYTWRPDVHTGFSGGGIMIGDEGGSFIDERYNRVIRFGNYGLAIMNGEGNECSYNRAVRGPLLFNGLRIALAPPTGLVAAQFWDYNRVGSLMRNNRMNSNFLAFQYQDASGVKRTKNTFVTVAGKYGNEFLGNTEFTGDVTYAMENAEHAGYRDVLAAAGLSFGPVYGVPA